MPPDAKQSVEGSQISWAYFLKLVKTYEIARSLINTYSTSLTTVKLFHLHSSIYFYWAGFPQIFWTLLGYTVAKAPGSPRIFNLFHQTVSPCEKVGSGDEASFVPRKLWSVRWSDCYVMLIALASQSFAKQQCIHCLLMYRGQQCTHRLVPHCHTTTKNWYLLNDSITQAMQLCTPSILNAYINISTYNVLSSGTRHCMDMLPDPFSIFLKRV